MSFTSKRGLEKINVDVLERLLGGHALVRRLGRNASRRVVADPLGPRQLTQLVDLIYKVEGRARATRAA